MESHFKTKKHLGQNFLTDKNILQKIIEAAELSKEDHVIEVGPGSGFLTSELVNNAKFVEAIELDNEVIPILKENIKSFDNFKIHQQDVLKFQIPNKAYKLIANIPYYLTSPIIRHFISESNNRPKLAVLMIQKEVAEKICAQDGKQSVLSWQVQLFGKPKIICKVSKNCFSPAPKVDSAVLKIEMFEKPLIENTDNFFKLIKLCFQNKRKQLGKNISNAFHLSSEESINLLNQIDIDPKVRAEVLGVGEWERILKNFCI